MARASNPGRRRPEQERSKQTVEDILDAAALVLKQVGIEQTTTDRVAERAGLSVGSLYQYFPNKIALYEALMARHLENVTITAISLAQRLHEASAQEFPNVLAQIMVAPERKDPQLSALLYRLAAMHKSVAAIEIERSRLFETSMAALLREKVATAGFRRTMDPHLASRILTRALAGLARRTMEIDPGLIESDAFASEVELLIRGYVLEPETQI